MSFILTNQYRLFRVTDVGGTETLTPLGHAQDNSFSMSADEIDVSTKDTPKGQSETIPGTINTTASVTGLVFEGDEIGPRELLQAIQGRDTWDVIFKALDDDGNEVPASPVVSGRFIWLSGGVNSNGNSGVVEYSGEGKFTGNVVIA